MSTYLKAAILSFCALFVAVVANADESYCVVYGPESSWAERYAAEKFTAYTHRLTGISVPAYDSNSEEWKKCNKVVLVGSPETNPVIAEIADTQIFKPLEGEQDGFVQKSIKHADKTYLVIGGLQPRCTVYGVYDYFEQFCNVGFFEDGDYVPRLAGLPFENINNVEIAHFKYRMRSKFGDGHVMLRKYTHHFWTVDDYKRNIDYWMKTKMNYSSALQEEKKKSP